MENSNRQLQISNRAMELLGENIASSAIQQALLIARHEAVQAELAALKEAQSSTDEKEIE